MMQSIHPFPARMAPELALETLRLLDAGAVVLDPMTGSGTVIQQAKSLDLRALGFDLDPLAVLISKVATTSVQDSDVATSASQVMEAAKTLRPDSVTLPWMDGDQKTEAFVNYWFGDSQRDDLRRISFVLSNPIKWGISDAIADVLRIALSRIIVTKASYASLAQDTSHSRPHKVLIESDYDVVAGFERSVRILRNRLKKIPATGEVEIRRGDARDLNDVGDDSVDAVLTSPPYLNAIDYMRGHKMSLIWLGFSLTELSHTRSTSIGAERRPDEIMDLDSVAIIKRAMGPVAELPTRWQGMVERYAIDLRDMLTEVARVLKPNGIATFVMGNSCLKGIFLKNSEALIAAGKLAGLSKLKGWERDLPDRHRYLPTPTSGSLSKRMRKEVIVRLRKP